MDTRKVKKFALYAAVAILALPIVWKLAEGYGRIWFPEEGALMFALMVTLLYAACAWLYVPFATILSKDK